MIQEGIGVMCGSDGDTHHPASCGDFTVRVDPSPLAIIAESFCVFYSSGENTFLSPPPKKKKKLLSCVIYTSYGNINKT